MQTRLKFYSGVMIVDMRGKMKDAMDKVKEFHIRGGIPVHTSLGHRGKELRIRLLAEEVIEYLDAEESGNLIEIAKELADIVYIVCGTALSYGIPMAEVFDKVHESNMTKFINGAKFREDGKLLKDDDYVSPEIEIKGILERVLLGCF